MERLEAKGLVCRISDTNDRRSTIVRLTEKGEKEFQRVFPPQIKHCKQPFLAYGEEDFAALERELAKLKQHLDEAEQRMKKGCYYADDQK